MATTVDTLEHPDGRVTVESLMVQVSAKASPKALAKAATWFQEVLA